MTEKINQPPTAPDKRICVGRIAAAHGIKGLVKIVPYCDDLSLLEQIPEFKIKLKNKLGKYILAEIEGINERNGAEALGGTELLIDRDALPDIEDEDEFYAEDLVGMKCVNESGEEIGVVKAVENYGAGDLLDIQPKSGASFLLPFNDDFVPEVGETITLRNYDLFLI